MGDAPPAREGAHNVIKPKRCFACKAVGHLIAHCPRNPHAPKPPTAPLPPQANRTNTPTSTPTPRGGGPQRNLPFRAGGAPWHQPYPPPSPRPQPAYQHHPQGGMMAWGPVGGCRGVGWGLGCITTRVLGEPRQPLHAHQSSRNSEESWRIWLLWRRRGVDHSEGRTWINLNQGIPSK